MGSIFGLLAFFMIFIAGGIVIYKAANFIALGIVGFFQKLLGKSVDR